jgi:hypothetical protein
MIRILPVIIAIVVLTLIGVLSSVFIVDERKQALVLQFGQVKQVKTDPGLGFKIPFIQDVAYYDSRVLPVETSALEVTPADERRPVGGRCLRPLAHHRRGRVPSGGANRGGGAATARAHPERQLA